MTNFLRFLGLLFIANSLHGGYTTPPSLGSCPGGRCWAQESNYHYCHNQCSKF
ncbi:MAG TPA: hypothetical protein VJN02_10640 [Gammaproteobacteria bacterium]|nr:hypothetical protein [Gammaproteobacteria bacterium]